MKGFDPQSMMAQAKKMKDGLSRVRADLKERMVEGAAAGGMVTVISNGLSEVQSVRIRKEAVNPDDVDMLEDLVIVALRAAMEKAKALEEAETGKVTGGMGGLGGML